MTLDTRQAFRFLQVNYKYGLLDEVGSIVGDALEAVMLEQHLDMEDVLNRLDGTDERTIERINDLLERRANLFFKLAANETMTRLQAALMRVPFVRRGALRVVSAFLKKKLSGGRTPGAGSGGGCAL
jgi:hypothetical protein